MKTTVVLLISLTVVVILAAYLLGLYLRRRDEKEPGSIYIEKPAQPNLPSAPHPAATLPDQQQLQKLVDWLLAQAFEQTGVNVAYDALARQRITEGAQLTLQKLQTADTYTLSLPFITADVNGPKHFNLQISRQLLRDLERF